MPLARPQRKIRAIARVKPTEPRLRASDICLAMLAAVSLVAGLLYLLAKLFPAIAA